MARAAMVCYKPIKGLFGIVWNEFDYISLPEDGATERMVVLAGGGAGFWRGSGELRFQHINYEILKSADPTKPSKEQRGNTVFMVLDHHQRGK